MGQTLQIGPLALPWALIILMIGWFAGTQLSERLARKRGTKVELHIWLLPIVGLVAARLGFVVQYVTAYAETPLGIFDIRDGGWEPIAGLVAIGVYVLALWIWHSATAKAMTAGSALFAAIWLSGNAALATQSIQGAALPEFKGVALNAQTLSLPELRGQPVVINLWATWCPPCRAEMPVLMAAQKANPSVRFLYINHGENPKTVLKYTQQIGIQDADVVLDTEEKLSRMLKVRGLPTTLFFDAQGKLVAKRTGELSNATLKQHLELITPKP